MKGNSSAQYLENHQWKVGFSLLLLLLIGLVFADALGADTIFRADFAFSPSFPAPGRSVSFIDASASLPSSWSWSFGDPNSGASNTSSERNPAHTYAAPGTYAVTLTIILQGPAYAVLDVVTKSVSVSMPGVPPVAPSDLLAVASSSSTTRLRWTDNSNNETGFKIERKAGAEGTYAQIGTQGQDQNFLNDSGLAPATQYCYRARATNGDGDSAYTNEACDTTQPPPGVAPVAQFVIRPGSAEPGQNVSFSDASTGSPNSWSWSFGDGLTSSAQNPTHVFPAAGGYAVTLTVANPLGSSSTSRTFAITAPPQIFSEFPVPTTASAAMLSIASGPDGNLWATARLASGGGGIVRISPADGSTTVYILSGIPSGITAGPDGNLWFTEQLASKIGRITTAGVITEFSTLTPNSLPHGITAGSDGNLWFTEQIPSKIGRITTSGVITEFAVPVGGNGPYGIAAGSDGNLWFTEYQGNKIRRITTSGEITEFPAPGASGGITAGPDGNLWFTEEFADKIGRITTSGVITEFAVSNGPYDIVSGADGALWFTECAGTYQIGRITTAGSVTEFSSPSNKCAQGIAKGSDGNIWYVSPSFGESRSEIGRITPAGAITTFPAPTDTTLPTGIAAGPDGALWFTEANAFPIGRITTSGAITEFPAPGASDGITAGPDGNLWFTAIAGIGKISLSGAVTVFERPQLFLRALTTGPDGNLWGSGSGMVARITPAAEVTPFTLAIGGHRREDVVCFGIAEGRDGNLWFTEFPTLLPPFPPVTIGLIGRITTSGTITEFAVPSTGPYGIAAGPDGNLWFTEQIANKIGRITTAGIITEFPIPTASSLPTGITAGSDGNLWFTEQAANKIGRITPTGVITEFPIPTPNAAPSGIATGPDGNIWFTEIATNKIGRLDLSALPRPPRRLETRVVSPRH